VRAQTLVIAGAEDVATPPSVLRALHDGLTDRSWLEIADAGHLANLEQPEQFGDAVSRFLADD
jgi:pimeloyl-ACP methyl ester carboxylesterase